MLTAATITLTGRRLTPVCSEIAPARRRRNRCALRLDPARTSAIRLTHASGLVHHRRVERIWPRARRGGSQARRQRRPFGPADRGARFRWPARTGRSALAIGLDVTDAEARKRAVDAALERFGRIDVLANIAGRGSLGAAEEFSPEQLREQMEVNFFAAAEMTRAVLPAMRAQKTRPYPAAHQHRRPSGDRRVRLPIAPRNSRSKAGAKLYGMKSSRSASGSRSSSRARSAPSSRAPPTCARSTASTPTAG